MLVAQLPIVSDLISDQQLVCLVIVLLVSFQLIGSPNSPLCLIEVRGWKPKWTHNLHAPLCIFPPYLPLTVQTIYNALHPFR